MYTLTINVSVVIMARYIMVLRGATSLRGALEGVGPKNRDFLGPKKSVVCCCVLLCVRWVGRSPCSCVV